MINIALHCPEIPQNTGNIIRLSANTGAALHLIRPLGFELDDARLRRAGLDYHEYAQVRTHDDAAALRVALPEARWLAFTTRGSTRYDRVTYRADDVLLFGSETAGLPQALLDALPMEQRIVIPQRSESRSLNLSNTVAIAVYQAWQQLGFA